MQRQCASGIAREEACAAAAVQRAAHISMPSLSIPCSLKHSPRSSEWRGMASTFLPASQRSRCSAQARASGLAGTQLKHARKARTQAYPQAVLRSTHTAQLPPSSRHHAETRHPGTASAAHRHARAGLRERNGRERNGPKPTRGARATRPATSQHRVGRRRRGSDERRRTLVCERASGWPRSPFLELRCRYFLLVRSLGV